MQKKMFEADPVMAVRALRRADAERAHTTTSMLRERQSTSMAIMLAVKFLLCNALTVIISLIEAFGGRQLYFEAVHTHPTLHIY
jgi:hypothetical protein